MKIFMKIMMIIIILITKHSLMRGQMRMQHLKELIEKNEELRFLSMPDTGKWIVWQSAYERRPPQLRMASLKSLKPLLIETGAYEWQFIRKDEILYRVGNDAKYRNLSGRKEQVFANVKSAGYLKHLDQMYIHHNDKESNRLDFYDKNLRLVQSVSNVNRLIKLDNEMMMIVKQNDSDYQVVRCNEKNSSAIFTSPSEIYSVSKSGINAGGWLVKVKVEKGYEMFFINPELSMIQLSVKDEMQFDGIQQNPSSDSHSIVLTLETIKTKEKALVDIWYGKDFNLEDHFKDQKDGRKILWYPTEGKVVETDHYDYSPIAAIGKSGLFLRSAIDHKQVDSNDKAAKESIGSYFIYDPKTGINTAFTETSKFFITDSTGNFVLFRNDDGWFAYNTSKRRKENKLFAPGDAIPYFISAEEVLWVMGHELWKQNLTSLKKKLLASFAGNDLEILNAKKNKSLMTYRIIIQSIDFHDNIVIKLISKKQNTSSVVIWDRGKSHIIVEQTKDKISDIVFNTTSKKYGWITENYNKAPEIKIASISGNATTIYSSAGNLPVNKIAMRTLKYKGLVGEDLSAVLLYPSGYSEYKKYPVVVSVYGLQQKDSNRYLQPTFKNSRGFNERFFLESGYMVMLPDINNDGSQGPGIAALHNVNAAMDELAKVKQADMKKVGLVGQSLGGYETNFIATQSDRFAAYISGASISDIINTSFAFNYNFFSADYYRYEDGQFKLGKFTNNKERYYKNNPLYYADKVQAPVLLWTGTGDKNVNPEQTRSFYNALRKYRKTVVALFYKDEQHSLMGYEQRKDLTVRMIEWFDYFLYDKKNVDWIDKQMIDMQ